MNSENATMFDRRDFLLASMGTAAWLMTGGLPGSVQAATSHALPPLSLMPRTH
jgi:superoxide dismutase, Fe-Mn family